MRFKILKEEPFSKRKTTNGRSKTTRPDLKRVSTRTSFDENRSTQRRIVRRTPWTAIAGEKPPSKRKPHDTIDGTNRRRRRSNRESNRSQGASKERTEFSQIVDERSCARAFDERRRHRRSAAPTPKQKFEVATIDVPVISESSVSAFRIENASIIASTTDALDPTSPIFYPCKKRANACPLFVHLRGEHQSSFVLSGPFVSSDRLRDREFVDWLRFDVWQETRRLTADQLLFCSGQPSTAFVDVCA